jgi:hypothetical protein
MSHKTIWSTALLAVCFLVNVETNEAVAAQNAKKLTDLTCTEGQTVAFDGSEWVCADFPSGVTGLQRIQVNSPLNTVATKQIDAVCPVGKKVVGGGHLFFFGGPTVPIRSSAPLLGLIGWRVTGTNTENTPWSVSAVAICADDAEQP